MVKEIIESIKCNKTYSLEYDGKVFNLMLDKKRRIGGNYPYGGEVKAKVDKELLSALEKVGFKGINIGDCVIMSNGWTLD